MGNVSEAFDLSSQLTALRVRVQSHHRTNHRLNNSDMADRFDGTDPSRPYAEITGSDLSPIQPGSQPSNCTFEVDDCCSEWVYQPETFGFIHIRGLYGSVADWPTLYAEAFQACKPGGWIEQVEWDMALREPSGQLTAHPVFKKWTDDVIDMGETIGKTMKTATLMRSWIQEAGFVDVVERKFKWPLGPWSSDPKLKEIGRWNLLNWEEGLEGWTLAHYTRVLGVCRNSSSFSHFWMSSPRFSVYLCRDNSHGINLTWHAQKPGTAPRHEPIHADSVLTLTPLFQWDADRVHDWVQQIRKSMRDRKVHVYHEM
jgi:hypothetical protein